MATSATSGSTNSSHKRDASHLDFSITNLLEQPLAPKRLRRLVPSEMEKTEAVWQTHAASQTLSASSNSNSNNGANGTGGCAEISMGTILSTGHYHEQNPALAAQTVSQIQTSDFPSDPGPGLSDPGEGIDVPLGKFQFTAAQTTSVTSPVFFAPLRSPVPDSSLLEKSTLGPSPRLPFTQNGLSQSNAPMAAAGRKDPGGSQGMSQPVALSPSFLKPLSDKGSLFEGLSLSSSNSDQMKKQAQEFERRGMECVLTDKYEEAVQHFERCLQLNPEEPAKILNLLALCLLRDFGSALSSNAYDVGRFQRERPNVDFARAVETLQKALSHPEGSLPVSLHLKLYFNLAMTHLCSGDEGGAIRAQNLLQEAVKKGENASLSLADRYLMAKICYQCAKILALQGKFNDANKAYTRAIRLHFEDLAKPNQQKHLLADDPYQRNLIAQVFLELGIMWTRWNLNEARACFCKLIELEKAKSVANKAIVASAFLELGKITPESEEKLKLFNQALSLDFNDPELKEQLLSEIARVHSNVAFSFASAQELLHQLLVAMNNDQATPLQRRQAQFDYAQTLERFNKPDNRKTIGEIYQRLEEALKSAKKDEPEALLLQSKVKTAMGHFFASQGK